MSRIDDALRQAGMKAPDAEAASQPDMLDSFRFAPDPDIAPPAPAAQKVVSEGATPIFFERLVVHENAEPVAVEQYRRVAAILHQSQMEKGNKVVMIASAQAAEGKTLTAANLALTLSESYRRRVLLIDADLRRPSLNRLFGLPHASGLSESLKASGDRALQLLTISPSLALLPGGRPDNDPMSGLTSGRMQQIIEQAAAEFDWVILDTPPVTLLTDTHLLAAMVDSAVLVIGAGSTPCGLVQQTIESIGRDKIVGVVLNRVDKSALKDASYDQYYRYATAGKKRELAMAASREAVR
jgi:capsular exopolysaccharide synthesis family protein